MLYFETEMFENTEFLSKFSYGVTDQIMGIKDRWVWSYWMYHNDKMIGKEQNLEKRKGNFQSDLNLIISCWWVTFILNQTIFTHPINLLMVPISVYSEPFLLASEFLFSFCAL